MEVPVINRIGDFDGGLNALQNPSLLSQLFALSGIEKIYQAYSFWKWGALILALLASVTTIINRLKILFLRLRTHPSSPSQPLLQDTDFDSLSDVSSSSSEDEQEYERASATASTSRDNWRPVDEDFHVRGSGHFLDDQGQSRKFALRRRRSSIGDLFSWAELTSGKSVVKLWDNFGLGFGLDLDESDRSSLFDIYDINREERVTSVFGGGKCLAQAVSSSSSPPVIISGGGDSSGRVTVGAWDTRLSCRIPSILAEWRPKKLAENIAAGVNAGGVQKVYVRDDVNRELMVADMRKMSSPLRNVTESDVDTWWDADAVIVSDESKDESMG